MKDKRFCFNVFASSIIIILILVSINYYVDLYGLFRNVKGRSISIYSDERTAKYLLAHKYVPENFEAYILGPSLSANLNPKEITDYKIYNLSMMGANISEQNVVAYKAMETSTPKFVIICLHPYLTIDHGMKSGMINPKEYYGALGSISLYKSYSLMFIRKLGWLPSKFPSDQYNDYGCNHYNDILKKMPVEEKIAKELKLDSAIKTNIDSIAWTEFKQLIVTLDKKNVRIITYFHPLPYLLYNKFRKPLEEYQTKVTATLARKATIINFNTPEYEFFTKDLTNYIDHGHLSDKGQVYLMKQIVKEGKLNKVVAHNKNE